MSGERSSQTGRLGSSAGTRGGGLRSRRPRLGARSPLPARVQPSLVPRARGHRLCALRESGASAFVDRDFLFSSFLLQGNSPQSWVCSGCRAHVTHPIRRLWTTIDGKELILNPSLCASRVFSLKRTLAKLPRRPGLTQTLCTAPPSRFPATHNSTIKGLPLWLLFLGYPSISNASATGEGGTLSLHEGGRTYSIV